MKNWKDIFEEALNESKSAAALADSIDKEISKIDDSMSYKDFATAIGIILREQYGQHNYKPFLKTLEKKLKVMESEEVSEKRDDKYTHKEMLQRLKARDFPTNWSILDIIERYEDHVIGYLKENKKIKL